MVNPPLPTSCALLRGTAFTGHDLQCRNGCDGRCPFALSSFKGKKSKGRSQRKPVPVRPPKVPGNSGPGGGYRPDVRTKQIYEPWSVGYIWGNSVDTIDEEFAALIGDTAQWTMARYGRNLGTALWSEQWHAGSFIGDSGFEYYYSDSGTSPTRTGITNLEGWMLPVIGHQIMLPLWEANSGFSPGPPLPNTKRDKAMDAMTPSLSTGFSALNFLYELKDFKSWFRKLKYRKNTYRSAEEGGIYDVSGQFKNSADLFKELKRDISRFGKGMSKSPAAELSGIAAELHLTWAFAIRPLIADIKKIVEILATFQERTNRFLSKADELELRRHFRSATQLEDTDKSTFKLYNLFDGTFFLPIPGGAGPVARFTSTLQPIVHSKGSSSVGEYVETYLMDFDYTVSQLVEMNSQVAALLQQLGIRPGLDILWNAFPFTFLVDWFVNVSDYLEDEWSWDLISAVVNIHAWMESVRARRSWDMRIEAGSFDALGATCTWNTQLREGILRSETYHRTMALPPEPESHIKIGDGLTLERAAISASLLRKIR